jgi:hypothetical protein
VKNIRSNARSDRPGLGMTARRLRSFAGLAAAIVPCAIIVHLVAEAAATGRDGLDFAFVVRHGYFGVLFLASAFWFGSTVGLGRPASERRRRCALLRADLGTAPRPQSLTMLVGANLGFFALTQAFEGVPVASGSFALGLGVALCGSMLSALLVFLFGRSIVAAALDSVIGTSPIRCAADRVARRVRVVAAPRDAASAYSLFIPNRPPPTMSQF